MTRILRAALAGPAAVAVLLALAGPAAAQVEEYADYQPQQWCSPSAKPGTQALARWLVRRGGAAGVIGRACRSGGVSEHKEGRAFDWTLDADRRAHSRIARAFLDEVFATDAHGNEHVKARRMGIMYIIWDDHIYRAWDHFEQGNYRSPSCKTLRRCSQTLRHRDHMHISLSRRGGRGETSWYENRVSAD